MKSRQKIQTKRNSRNKKRWEAKVDHANRVLNKQKYYRFKARNKNA